MINDPKYINELLDKLKKVSKEELDEAIQKVDMEDNKRRIEALVVKCDTCKMHECIGCEIVYNDIRAIKSLIKENNDLRKENKTLKETEPVSIPISVIQNKLEQNKAKTDCRYCNNACDSYAVCTVLQELLEERNK